jgi:hypothetical protein
VNRKTEVEGLSMRVLKKPTSVKSVCEKAAHEYKAYADVIAHLLYYLVM